jgi:hypothetical protein
MAQYEEGESEKDFVAKGKRKPSIEKIHDTYSNGFCFNFQPNECTLLRFSCNSTVLL